MKGQITGLQVTSVLLVVWQLPSIPLFNPYLVPKMCSVCQSKFMRCSLWTLILGNTPVGWADGALHCLPLSIKERERSQGGEAIWATLFLWKGSSISDELCWEQRTEVVGDLQVIVVGWVMTLKVISVGIPGTCECYFIYSKRLCRCGWSKNLEMSYLDYLGAP